MLCVCLLRSVCMCTELGVVPLEQEAFSHYQKNTMSIEVLKDDSLQKINFRVKNKVTLHCSCRLQAGPRVMFWFSLYGRPM